MFIPWGVIWHLLLLVMPCWILKKALSTKPLVNACQSELWGEEKRRCYHRARNSSVTTVQNTFLHICIMINKSDVWSSWRYKVNAFIHAQNRASVISKWMFLLSETFFFFSLHPFEPRETRGWQEMNKETRRKGTFDTSLTTRRI